VADRKPLIFPISALGANFNPQNTKCIPPVKIFARLELEKNFRVFVQALNIAFFSVITGIMLR